MSGDAGGARAGTPDPPAYLPLRVTDVPIRSQNVGMSPVAVRSYRPSDHSAGRRLWSELTHQHNEMYGDAGGRRRRRVRGVPDPARPERPLGRRPRRRRGDRPGRADHAGPGRRGRAGGRHRTRTGTRVSGASCCGTSRSEAKKRSMLSLTISPASRNVDAIRSLHAAGYDVVSSIELTMDLDRHAHEWQQDGLELHELPVPLLTGVRTAAPVDNRRVVHRPRSLAVARPGRFGHAARHDTDCTLGQFPRRAHRRRAVPDRLPPGRQPDRGRRPRPAARLRRPHRPAGAGRRPEEARAAILHLAVGGRRPGVRGGHDHRVRRQPTA